MSLPAPDSPRSEQSPAPPGIQGDLEAELHALALSLFNLGTTVVHDSTHDAEAGGKQVGSKVNDIVSNLSNLDLMSQNIPTMIPMQVLADIDNSRNPMQLTKERLERAATENQFMNGKIAAIKSYRQHLDEAIAQNFPELESHLKDDARESHSQESQP